MIDRRVKVVAVLVVLVALAFGGWGLYEVGKSHGAQQAQTLSPAGVGTSATQGSAVPAGPQSDIVHATRTGKRYHAAGCRYLAKSDIPISRGDAEAKGLTPCGVCNP